MELGNGASVKPSKGKTWLGGSKVLTFAVVVIVVLASVATAGYVLVRYGRGLSFSVSTNKVLFSSGEMVQISASYTNFGFSPVHLTFPTSQKAYFSVYAIDGALVCSLPVAALMVITEVTIKPGKSSVFGTSWDQLIHDGHAPPYEQVPHPGVYYIVAGTTSYEYHSTDRSSLFTIL